MTGMKNLGVGSRIQRRWENCTQTERKLARVLKDNKEILNGEEPHPKTLVFLPHPSRWKV